jgi:Zn-dependent protease
MTNLSQGSIRLFRVAGVNVFLHWSWFAVALFEINARANKYSSVMWNILEYVSLFAIVTLHEFGHALACRQVGGIADQIVLWPMGGVAYVNPPPRPGAMLWSISAGPLVNVALVPVFLLIGLLGGSAAWIITMPNAHTFLQSIAYINLGLLIFNLLPIYPLDGGQILRSLLWFALGRARSLMVAAIIGFAGALGLIALAAWLRSVWFVAIAVFVVMNCWKGFQVAQELSRVAKSPRRSGFACPSCKTGPPSGALWVCNKCKTFFDTFETQAVCPNCAERFAQTACMDCRKLHPMSEWISGTTAPTSVRPSPSPLNA